MGDELFRVVSAACGSINETACKIREGSGTKLLVIDCLPSFASCRLLPRLSSCYADNPEGEVEINTVDNLGHPATVARTPNSVAIRFGINDLQWQSLMAEKLVHGKMLPVCAPSLLVGSVQLREPRDLAAHTLMIVSRRPEGWPEWLEAAGHCGDARDGVDPNDGR